MPASQRPKLSPIQQIVDDFGIELNIAQQFLVLGHTAVNLSKQVIDNANPEATAQVLIADGVMTSPKKLIDLAPGINSLPLFLSEIIHAKVVQMWHGVLLSIFTHFVDQHFEGSRTFKELKKHKVEIDFNPPSNLSEQARLSLIRDFDFFRYAKKVDLIRKTIPTDKKHDEHFAVIKKHVHVRNCFQHRAGVVDEFMLKQLGTQSIVLLDGNGKEYSVSKGDSMRLSLPEVDILRRSLLRISQLWRETSYV